MTVGTARSLLLFDLGKGYGASSSRNDFGAKFLFILLSYVEFLGGGGLDWDGLFVTLGLVLWGISEG